MGIRIHKILGWGVNYEHRDQIPSIYNLEEDFDEFCRSMEDRQKRSELAEKILEFRGVGDYIKVVESSLASTFIVRNESQPNIHTHVVDIGGYVDDGNVLMLSLGRADWQRYDDDIDYVEWYQKHRYSDISHEILELRHSCGIYPYLGVELIRGRTPVKGNFKYSPSEYNQMIGVFDQYSDPTEDPETVQQLIDNYRPVIPYPIYALFMNVPILKNWETEIDKLRPMIATYWF